MTKKNPKVFLKQLGIEPTRENMIKFYRCGWTLSELKAGRNFIDQEYEIEKNSFLDNLIVKKRK